MQHREGALLAPAPSMRKFFIVWSGQIVSMAGSGLTSFALGFWVLLAGSGSATQYTLTLLFTLLPTTILSPFAGALVDRWDRRRTMIVSDALAGLLTIITVVLFWTGQLQVWHIWLIVAANSICRTFQRPAFGAAISLIVPKDQLGRANGMVQLALGVAELIAPVCGGALLSLFGLSSVLLIDFATFLVSMITLSIVRFPRLPAGDGAETSPGTLLADVAAGWSYLTARMALLQLMLLLAISNFLFGFVQALAQPMMLGYGAQAATIGLVLTIGGSGLLVGAVVTSVWGGPKQRVKGMLGFLLLCAPALMLGGLRPSSILIAVAAFVLFFCQPFINTAFYSLMQTKVAPSMQGRTFAISQMLTSVVAPVAYLVAGPLADTIFNPLLEPGGALADSIGAVIGVGPGRGIGLLFIVLGILMAVLVSAAYLYPKIRSLEEWLPDALLAADQPDGSGAGFPTEEPQMYSIPK